MAVLAAATRVLLALVIAGGVWLGLQQWRAFDRTAEKRALMSRAADLSARALTPGSPLACLAAGSADGLDTACESVIFAKPENAAAALAYADAQLSLLSDAVAFAASGEADFAEHFTGLRRTIELDRYGLVAHLLSARDGCTSDTCPAFARLRNAEVIKANIKGHTFDSYVARHLESWTVKPMTAPVAAPAAPAPVEEPAPPQASAPRAPGVKYDFPSAASIPPVSIMNAEPPPAKPANGEGTTADQPSARPDTRPLPVPPRRPQNQAAGPEAR